MTTVFVKSTLTDSERRLSSGTGGEPAKDGYRADVAQPIDLWSHITPAAPAMTATLSSQTDTPIAGTPAPGITRSTTRGNDSLLSNASRGWRSWGLSRLRTVSGRQDWAW